MKVQNRSGVSTKRAGNVEIGTVETIRFSESR